jgi:cysteine synthase A
MSTPTIFRNGIFIKDESKNPSGSVKIRPASYMLSKALERGDIVPGKTIITEATSGNMGIALAYEAKKIDCKVVIFMPASMTPERVKIMEDLGVEVRLVKNFEESIVQRDILSEKDGYFSTNQFLNPDNAKSHYEGLGKEIVEAAISRGKKIEAVVLGSGTGGTFMGVKKRVLESFPNAEFFLMEPTESQYVKTGKTGPHKIAGVQDGTIKCLLCPKEISGFIDIPGEDAIARAISLNKEGYKVGVSSGAYMLAAEKIAQKNGIDGSDDRVVVTIYPDSADRYDSVFSIK